MRNKVKDKQAYFTRSGRSWPNKSMKVPEAEDVDFDGVWAQEPNYQDYSVLGFVEKSKLCYYYIGED